MGRPPIVIIGAGFAGAATAYHLARLGVDNVLILEQEVVPGFHASGRSAAMLRQVVSEDAVGAAAREGAEFLLGNGWVRVTGSLLLGTHEDWRRLCEDARAAAERGVELEVLDSAAARRECALLEGALFDGAVATRTDGVIDSAGLLQYYLSHSRLRTRAKVSAIEVRRGRVEAVVVEGERIAASVVVNAAGPWANEVARMAGAEPLPLRPCRRHLFHTGPLSFVNPGWPFVWDISHGLYGRPESGGLLLSPCDEEEHVPGDPPVDSRVQDELMDKCAKFLPAAAGAPIRSAWAGLRTLASDGRFVIGWDARVEGFFWVAGLGGHGVTASWAVGRLAAERLTSSAEGGPFTPGRFRTGAKAA